MSSTNTATGGNTNASPKKPTMRRRGKRTARTGVSLLAQGEPMVWLTGGALALSLVMIISLLLLIVVQGARTFIPQPIDHVVTADGAVMMGEVTRQNDYTINEELLARLSDEARTRVAAEVAERGELHRRLYRIGNYELTNEHFRWVSDFELTESPRQPEWAVLVERLSWGRFYGIPQAFTINTPREPGQREKALVQLVEFADANGNAFSDENMSPYDVRTAVGEVLAAERAPAIASFLDPYRNDDSYSVMLPGRRLTGVNDVNPDAMNVIGVRQAWHGSAEAWDRFTSEHAQVLDLAHQREHIEKHDIGSVNGVLEAARLGVRQAEIDYDLRLLQAIQQIDNLQVERNVLLKQQDQVEAVIETAGSLDRPAIVQAIREAGVTINASLATELARVDAAIEVIRTKSLTDVPAEATEAVNEYERLQETAGAELAEINERIDAIRSESERYALWFETAQGQEQLLTMERDNPEAFSELTEFDQQGYLKELMLSEIVRAYPANRLSFGEKVGVYISRWWEFLVDDPREANQEGGVFPAIFGTVLMTIIMSVAVVPFGVLAALYLGEYAKAGFLITSVRIAINNLAGVPSIVFGVFGLGFFCYLIGAYVDGGPKNIGVEQLGMGTWLFFLFGWIATVAVGIGLWFTLLGKVKGNSAWYLQRGKAFMAFIWVTAVLLAGAGLFATAPFFNGLFEAKMPNPTFGKGGLLWASLTLALLTLPVVIVATEEALSAVPNSMREGSYACGASKWQTIRRIVLPRAMPGIMTGAILSMARGAGEVAPLMLVGAVKLAPELPGTINSIPPFVHVEYSFMHLGFHIYDVGFQSPNSEAAKPMVFTTTLLLILIVATLNIAAIWLRGRLRRRFAGGQF